MRSLVVICVLSLLLLPVAGGAETILWIPAAASNTGLQGTQWTTDLWLYSRVTDAPIEVAAAFLPDQLGIAEPTEVTIQLPEGEVVEVSDAVATLFGESRPGAIRLRSEHPFSAQSRTVNSGGTTGTYGQGIPAFPPPDQANSPDGLGYDLLGGANIPGADGVRTNLGIVNTSDQELELYVAAEDDRTGEPLGLVTVELGPFGWLQTDVFALLGAGDRTVELGHVAVAGRDLDSLFLVYLSRVDNRSGDGAFLAGLSGEMVRILPHPFEVELVVTYDGGATVSEVTYTLGDASTVTVPSPASGYTTGPLQCTSPITFCYTVTGDATSGSITVDRYVTRVDTGSLSHSRTTQSGVLVNISKCVDVE